MARQKPRSALNRALTWTAGLGFTLWIFWALYQSSLQVGTVVVRTDHDAEDRKLGAEMFAGEQGVYGVIRVAPELVSSAPKTGTVYVRAVNSSLASGQTVALKAAPHPVRADGPMLFHIKLEDFNTPGAMQNPMDLSAHWSQGDNPTVEVKGDLKGKCAQNPLKNGDQLAIIVLGHEVGAASQPTSGY